MMRNEGNGFLKESMLDALEETAARAGDRIAFEDDRESLTYGILRDKARRIGSAIAKLAESGAAVALLLDARSLRNIPAIYGALYAGCAYAPLDISMPLERLELLLERLEPEVILADEKGEMALAACENPGAPLLRYAEAEQWPVSEERLTARRQKTGPDSSMSILFTSGSTGIPKGSVQTHASYLRWTEATIAMYGLAEDTVFGNQSPFFYANSILDIFPPVKLGARVYLLPSGVLTFPGKLIECLRQHHVTEFCMTPSSFIAVAHAGVLEPGCLPELKWGVMSGESMPWEPLARWMEATPNAGWWHFYGSTEMFSVAVGRVAGKPPEGERLPVGRLFPGVRLFFVDEEGEPVHAGTPGEMLVSSPWISREYHRDAERTAMAWVTDPMGTGEQIRYYRGGDLGYLRPDGQLMVLGRRDAQIKHMGYRMELGEVEAALRAIPGWRDGCVLFDAESDKVWCFYTGLLTEKQLRQALKRRLARYMIPDHFICLQELPHTASMKLDRAALRRMMQR